jgi:type II secretory pathway pseudopilin PulG
MYLYSMKTSSRKAFILIEVIAATVIIAVSLTLIMQSFVSNTRAVALQKDYTQAIIILENHLSRLLYTGADVAMSNNNDEEHGRFDYKHVLSPTDEEHIKTALLTVKWPSGKKQRSLSVTTLLFNAANEKTRTFF